MHIRSWGVSGIALASLCALLAGCGTETPVARAKAVKLPVVHTDQQGFPVPPFSYRPVQSEIVPAVSWNHITTWFGYDGKFIVGKSNSRWVPLTLIEQSLKGARFSSSLKKRVLNVTVPSSIQVGDVHASMHGTPTKRALEITINGHPAGEVPWLRSSQSKDSYVPVTKLISALAPIPMDMRWRSATAEGSAKWEIGSPLYGLVTTITAFDGGHGSSKKSAMTILHGNDNWIQYDYLTNALGNIHGLQVTTLGNFGGINITVSPPISVNMTQLNLPSTPPKHEVPIEINGRVVGYAYSLLSSMGVRTGYLSSAEVMSAIRRIGLKMHWNGTDGTFTVWHITEPSRRQP